MKHFQEPIPAEIYYHRMWRMHCARLLVTLTLLANCIVWAIVAAFYGNAHLVIWLTVASVFFTFLAMIKMKDVDYYYHRKEMFKPQSLIDVDHTCE